MSTSMSTSTSTSDNNVDFIHKCAEILQPYCITAFTKANHNPLLELAYVCGAAYNASGSPYSEAVVQKYADVLHYAISSWLTRYPSMTICKELQELLEERTTRYCHFKISTKLFQQFERELFILSPDHYVDDFEFLIKIRSAWDKYYTEENAPFNFDELHAKVFESIRAPTEEDPTYNICFTQEIDQFIVTLLIKGRNVNPDLYITWVNLIIRREQARPWETHNAYLSKFYVNDCHFIRELEKVFFEYCKAREDHFEGSEKFIINHFLYLFSLFEVYVFLIECRKHDVILVVNCNNIGDVFHYKLRRYINAISDEKVAEELEQFCIARDFFCKPIISCDEHRKKAWDITAKVFEDINSLVEYTDDISYLLHLLELLSHISFKRSTSNIHTESLTSMCQECLSALEVTRRENVAMDMRFTSCGDVVSAYIFSLRHLLYPPLYLALYMFGLRRKAAQYDYAMRYVEEKKSEEEKDEMCVEPVCKRRKTNSINDKINEQRETEEAIQEQVHRCTSDSCIDYAQIQRTYTSYHIRRVLRCSLQPGDRK